MYGLFHVELQHFLETRYGRNTWSAVLKHAGLKQRIYVTHSMYEDAEMMAIVDTASEVTGLPVSIILENFGVFVAATLMNTYAPLINPKWGLMDFLLQAEDTVHRVVRGMNPAIQPPSLKFERTSTDVLSFLYDSPRRMPYLAKGIIQGIAAFYGEPIAIEEQHHPDGSVGMTIRLLEPR